MPSPLKALDPAQKAVMLANAFPALHTLACLYAEIGKTTEARDAIVQALDVSGQDEPEGNSWYVFAASPSSSASKTQRLPITAASRLPRTQPIQAVQRTPSRAGG